MAQILDLSKRYSKEQIENAQTNTYEDLPAGGYICKIVKPVLNDDMDAGKANIELNVDIAEGKFAGYFQKLEDKYGFWGLRGWMSFKPEQLGKFRQACRAICDSNPGFVFDPTHEGGADVDSLTGKRIGVVIGKEEYKSNSGDIREKNVVVMFTEIEKIKAGKFKVPEVRKLKEQKTDWMNLPETTQEEIPF